MTSFDLNLRREQICGIINEERAAGTQGMWIRAARRAEEECGVSVVPDTLRKWFARLDEPTERRRVAFEDVLDVNVRPFAVPVPRPVKPTPTPHGLIRTVVFGDSHVPYHAPDVLDIIYGVIEDEQPTNVVHIGDLLDCYNESSKFSRDPARLHSLQDEIDIGRAVLWQIAKISPQSRRVWLEGNHEDRLRRMIWDLDGAARTLPQLRVFREVMTWPHLMGLSEIGFEFYPYTQQPIVDILPRWALKHGNVVRTQSGYSARGEHERTGMSGCSGHTHRLGQFYTSDWNGAHVWVECGCTCSLVPHYGDNPRPNWQNGFAILTHEPQTGAFEADLRFIHRGNTIHNQMIYGQLPEARVHDGG